MSSTPKQQLDAIAARHSTLQVVGEIRPGGQKSVWKVTFESKLYALKILRGSADTIERARREINIMKECSSEHLVTLGPIDMQEIEINDDSLIYYLEEFIEGLPVDQISKPMSLKDCVSLGEQLGEAVRCLWDKHYVHRDIKPQNIIRRGDGLNYVLLDTGFALDLEGSSISDPGAIVGTTLYLSPDQLRLAKRQLDFRSDLHAIGLCMYECATGEHPLWNSKVPRYDLRDNILNQVPPPFSEFRKDMPGSLQRVILRLLEKEPNLRYARVDHFIDELRQVEVP
jgi:serine/threonine protein kinase